MQIDRERERRRAAAMEAESASEGGEEPSDNEDIFEAAKAPESAEPTNAPHPDRQDLIAKESVEPTVKNLETPKSDRGSSSRPRQRERKHKSKPFVREHEAAERRKAEAEARQKAREEAKRQRLLKIEERERFRRAMAKARAGGKNGQRKLGRESKVLLERVKRMTEGV